MSVQRAIDYRALRADIRIIEVLELLGFAVAQRSGDQVRGSCPNHKSRSVASRSFSANLRTNVYRCFGCGSSGNQLDLWCAATAQPLHEGALDLCDRLGRAAPRLNLRQTSAPPAFGSREKRNP